MSPRGLMYRALVACLTLLSIGGCSEEKSQFLDAAAIEISNKRFDSLEALTSRLEERNIDFEIVEEDFEPAKRPRRIAK